MLNDQCSSWLSVQIGVLQDSILGALFFFIYMNDFTENLQSTMKLFVDDTSLFSTIYDPNIAPSQLESDLKKISRWVYKWEMTFNPDLSKQAQEVIFSRKAIKVSYSSITFDTVSVPRTTCQNHLGLYLHVKYMIMINVKISKANKGIGIIKSLLNTLPEIPFYPLTNLS